MKWIKRILVVLLVFMIVLSASVYFYLQSFQPTYEGELSLSGLAEEVEVYFDDYGIPHIYAQNEADAYFALGYVHAKERLFQMEMLRRVGSGRLAEVFGEGLLENDRFFRTIGIREVSEVAAKEYMSESNEPFQKAAFAYLKGINTFIQAGDTPLEYKLLGLKKERFTIVDLYCIAGYMAYSFNVAFRTDPILTKIHNKLGEKYTKDFSTHWIEGTQKIPVYPKLEKSSKDSLADAELITQSTRHIFDQLPVPVWLGSNSWVVAGEKTKSGKVFFANDAHIGFGQPSVWYESHLEYPGFSFYGNYIAGMPFAPIGHTRRHAWGITMLENDETDLYQEKLNPNNPNQVKYKDSWENLTIRTETIKIKGQEDLVFEVKASRHGPIINDCIQNFEEVSQDPVTAFMTYTRFPNQGLQGFYQLGKGYVQS
ncbi:MAG: penicillin acylase family protein [Bacteroidota bacterium]